MDASRAIADYALLSDCQGAALVARDGAVEWACLPRFDSPAVFARLLGGRGGTWRISPADPAQVERRYVDDTMVLRTEFRTAAGTATCTDLLALGRGERGHEIGLAAPHALVRGLEGVSGEVDFDLEFAPRPEYGLTTPLLLACEGGLRSRGGPSTFACSWPVDIDLRGCVARGRIRIRAGQRVAFVLSVGPAWSEPGEPWSQEDAWAAVDDTAAAWRSWAGAHPRADAPNTDLVRFSGRVLQALTYAPSGAMIAAPTTSLPENPGGSRNWDYRFAWVRDASLTLRAFDEVACGDEAHRLFDFFVTAAAGEIRAGADLQPLYGVRGDRLILEHELAHLDGFCGSRPVRIGNGALEQRQLDGAGAILDAACHVEEHLDFTDDVLSEFLARLADQAAETWTQMDNGIWERRDGLAHNLHSKLHCWVALDRARRLAPRLGRHARPAAWNQAAHAVRTAILERGWDSARGAFTGAFDRPDLDAAALTIPIVGFLPPTDARVLATISRVQEELTDDNGFVYRFLRSPDEEPEGTFGLCTFWLVECLAGSGRVEEAEALFQRMADTANDVGLLAEQVDPTTGALLGNFPQAYTHVGLILAASAITAAKARTEVGSRG